MISQSYIIAAKKYYSLLFVLLFLNVMIYTTIFSRQSPTVSVFDGGYALVSLNKQLILVNAGSDASILRSLGRALSPWQRSIGLVILSATNTKTAGGLSSVVARYHVNTLARFGARGSDSQEAAYASAVRAVNSAHPKHLPYGATLALGSVTITPIAPGAFRISSLSATLTVSSSTPRNIYPL